MFIHVFPRTGLFCLLEENATGRARTCVGDCHWSLNPARLTTPAPLRNENAISVSL
jgi:hypothetical protein